jgi:hypothetical protein
VFAVTASSISGGLIKYNKVYSEVFGFSAEAKSISQNPPENNIYIFNTEKQWLDFSQTHLNNLKISPIDFNNYKLLYLQVDWPEPLSGSSYSVRSIEVTNNNLNVYIKRENTKINVSAKKGIFFKYIIILTIDKNSVPENAVSNLIVEN